MAIAFFLVTMSRICLFCIPASVILRFFGLKGNLLFAFFLVLLCGLMCYILKERKGALYRLLPLLLLPVCFFFTPGLLGAVFILPPMGYVAYCAIAKDFRLSYGDLQDLFMLSIKILPAFSVLALAFMGFAPFVSVTLPYILLFLCGSVLALRMLRHDEALLQKPTFQLLNALLIIALLALSVLLSSDVFLIGMKEGLALLYRNVLAPILMALGYLVAGIAFLVGKIFSFIRFTVSPLPDQGDADAGASPIDDFSDIVLVETPEWLSQLALALAILLFFYLAYRLFRYLLAKSRWASVAQGDENVSHGELQRQQKARRAPARGPCAKMRELYRRFLRRLSRQGVELSKTQTSLDIEARAEPHYPSASLASFRALYIQARYGERADSGDLFQMKQLFTEFKQKK